MTLVTPIRSSIATAAVRTSRSETSGAPAARTAGTRALIALAPVAPSDAEQRPRPQAGFLAHLIATDGKLPQTRRRRRAEPAEAIAAYTAAMAIVPPRGRLIFRLT